MEAPISDTPVKTEPTSDETNVLDNAFNSVVVTLATLKAQVTAAQQQVRAVQRMALKEQRQLKKQVDKRKNRQNRAPSGFAKEAAISDELRDFIGAGKEDKFARTSITQIIIKYIKDNSLQNKDNKKEILPDDKLKKLLKLGEGEMLTYFNLQKYMNKHFPKAAKKN